MGSLKELKAMMAFVEEKKIAPVIDRVLPLAEGREGVKAMMSFSQMGKIVLRHT